MTPDELFAGYPLALQLYVCVHRAVAALGLVGVLISKSQVAFRRRRAFAWAWRPGQYLQGHTAPLVLSIALPWRSDSPRWKEVIEPAPGRFMHLLELSDPAEIDAEVGGWLRSAWDAAA